MKEMRRSFGGTDKYDRFCLELADKKEIYERFCVLDEKLNDIMKQNIE